MTAGERVACFRAAVVLERVRSRMDHDLTELSVMAGDKPRAGYLRREIRRDAAFLPRAARMAEEACGIAGAGISHEADGVAKVAPGRGALNTQDLYMWLGGIHREIDRAAGGAESSGPAPSGGPPGEPPLIVFATDGYVTIRGPKHDLTAYLRLTDCDIDYEIYPTGEAPPSGTDEEVGEQHQKAQDTIALDGGMWTTKNCTSADLEGIAGDIFDITGTRVRVGLAPPPGGGMDQALRKHLGLPEEDED